MSDYEHCIECEERTGRAGASDDSLYHGYSGPFCEDCFDAWPDNQVSQIILLRQELKQAQARVAELESTLNDANLQVARIDKAHILRKQAEAVDEAQERVTLADSRREMQRSAGSYAAELRQQADEAERAGGGQ